ncbi:MULTISPECIES: MinD/ParA family protein [unclassified Bacillus (in: firmicutes)]|uniref:MinD/ParA family protein n=1 Tax=unclassified Bacillus (in: firmicutes) TaxID=185979 RepID=UPI0008DF99BE|nr:MULTISPECIES: MinD/ParA family protein [unclassified Bacillus (in: firmicutes)]SFA73813.1 flagellar biosynthesis protein FlhG [Bacillus sp. UNCCL13]SFQ64034.1 flagellar biosynthesis protein FlhG [Bacillus sp. cl95]
MKDQAESLRLRLKSIESQSFTNAIAIVSGKGGVGKSNFSLNFSISLAQKGYKVLVFDMDIGMGNLDILMGKSSDKSIVNYLNGTSGLKEIMMDGPQGIRYIAGGTGLTQLVQFDEGKLRSFIDDLHHELNQFDFLIFDMGAGVTEDSLRFLLSVNEIIVVTTPEPTSLTDAYATLKHLNMYDNNIPFYVVVNRALSEKDGKDTLKRLSDVVQKFLNKEIVSLGMLPDDRNVQQSVRNQIPFLLNSPKSEASKALEMITAQYVRNKSEEVNSLISHSFMSKLKRFLFER